MAFCVYFRSEKRLQKFDILAQLPQQNRINTRLEAMREAIALLEREGTTGGSAATSAAAAETAAIK
ncbi:MAG: hypothetical protein HC838_09940 [Spirulinaceae cyanobacterium RM2_2_10]|nr:hypothetical protein [Spirulinaceae cyanobacterium SM2_1_0]NJO20289.1 hypothetical protein [Spirulinaceae cyanobacterium RM2_2_10]